MRGAKYAIGDFSKVRSSDKEPYRGLDGILPLGIGSNGGKMVRFGPHKVRISTQTAPKEGWGNDMVLTQKRVISQHFY